MIFWIVIVVVYLGFNNTNCGWGMKHYEECHFYTANVLWKQVVYDQKRKALSLKAKVDVSMVVLRIDS